MQHIVLIRKIANMYHQDPKFTGLIQKRKEAHTFVFVTHMHTFITSQTLHYNTM